MTSMIDISKLCDLDGWIKNEEKRERSHFSILYLIQEQCSRGLIKRLNLRSYFKRQMYFRRVKSILQDDV